MAWIRLWMTRTPVVSAELFSIDRPLVLHVTGHDHSTAVPDEVEEILCRDPDVEFVVLFGSRASGTARRSSDLDVVVKFEDSLSPTERFRKRCRLSGQLQSDEGPFVDLVDLDDVPIELAHAALDGTLVCGDEEVYEQVQRAVATEFESRRSAVERTQRETIRRIAEEGLRG